MKAEIILTAVALLCGHGVGWGQTQVHLRTQAKEVDFSGAPSTKPNKMGLELPATCAVGETFFLTTAASGKNLYGCTEPDAWTLLGSATDLPVMAGQAHKILATDGVNAAWQGLGGDISGAPGAVTVGRIQGRPVGSQAPQGGDVLKWDNTAGQWLPAAETGAMQAGTGVVIAGDTISSDEAVVPFYLTGTTAPSLNCEPGRDFYTDLTTGTLYFCRATDVWSAVGGGGEANTASNVGLSGIGVFDSKSGVDLRFRKLNSISSALGITLNGQQIDFSLPKATGSVAGYLDSPDYSAFAAKAATGSCTGQVVTGTTSSGVNCASLTAGTGIVATGLQFSVNEGVVPLYSSSTTDPSAPCNIGQLHLRTDTNEIFHCSSVNTWTKLAKAPHTHAAGDLASGQLSLARGGTGADLSTTGGSGRFLKQSTTGGPVTVETIQASELPAHGHTASDITGGTLEAARGGTGQSSYSKGDLLAATGSTTLSKLAVGANGQVLTADSGTASGLKWATASGGGSTSGVPWPNTRRWAYIVAPGAGTTWDKTGDGATTTGTASAVAASADDPTLINYASGASAGSRAEIVGYQIHRMGRNILSQTTAAIQETAAVRAFIGLADQNWNTMTGSDDPVGNYAGFRFSAGTDTNWRCVQKDGVTQSTADSGVAPTATTQKFQIMINDTGGTITYSINGSQVCQIGTNRPTAGTNLRYGVGLQTTEAVAKNIRIAWVYMESDK